MTITRKSTIKSTGTHKTVFLITKALSFQQTMERERKALLVHIYSRYPLYMKIFVSLL